MTDYTNIVMSEIRLKTRLREALVPSAYRGDRRFIPCGQLKKIFDTEIVENELRRSLPGGDSDSYKKCASLICHGQIQGPSTVLKPCFKIFVILVLINKVKLIEIFQKYSLCDDDLPFYYTTDFKKLWSHRKEPKNPKNILEFPGEAEVDEFIENFARMQWSVLAPSFEAPTKGSMRCNVYTFEERTILPIINVSKKTYPGGFGLVEKVELHDDHNGFGHSYFALKTMHPLMPFDVKDTVFQQELNAFQKAKPGSHLIEICAAFKKGDNYSFLFPWADGGTLNHLWNEHPYEIITKNRVGWSEFCRWICMQCHGIFRDLRAIHEPHDKSQRKEKGENEELYGIHSDIKPDNLLYFTKDGPPLGRLKVSDLGLMKFHRLISRTVQSKSMGNAYQTYRAPEHDLGMVRSRKIDIWAFGCLFAEFLTWAINGKGGIEDFKTKRINEDILFPDKNKGEWSEDHFFTMRTKEPKRKDSVDEWFADLSKELVPNTFFPQFLRFIQNSMLHPNRKSRVECWEVENFLEKCLKNPADSSYWHFHGAVPDQNSYSRSTTDTSTW